jgi:hypothetical protein
MRDRAGSNALHLVRTSGGLADVARELIDGQLSTATLAETPVR